MKQNLSKESQLLDKHKMSNCEDAYNIILHEKVWRFQKYMELIERLLKLDMKYCRELGERSLIYQILAYLYEDSYKGRLSQPVNSKRIELLTMLVKYIETHLEEDISLDDLATMSNYSVTHISRTFKEETNSTLNHYILEKRLQKAKYLLSGTIPITEVAQQTGFNSYSHFYRVFKKSNGIGPEKWRQSNWQNRDV